MARRKSKKKAAQQKPSLRALRAQAEQARKDGRPEEAIAHWREIIQRTPGDGEAHFHLGNLLRETGRLEDALSCYREALAIDPDNLAIQFNQANMLQRLGQIDEALSAYRHILKVKPDFAVGHFNLGLALNSQGDLAGAAAAFRQALSLQPALSVARYQLAQTLARQGRLLDAVQAYRLFLRAEPSHAVAQRQLGDILQRLGAYSEAIPAYQAAARLQPNDGETFYSLGTAQQQLGQYDEAMASYRRSIERNPGQLEAYAGLGNTLHQVGRVDEAREQYRAALKINPAFAHARFGACISELPIVYRSEEHVQTTRQRYAEALEDLYQYYLAANPEERSRAADAVGFLQPFYLSYQGLPVRDLQERYGAIIGSLMAARYPEFVGRLAMPATEGKIRLGFVSGFLRNHPSWNPFQGLAEAIDRSRFEIYMFHTRSQRDRETRLLEHLCDGFVQGPLVVGDWARAIREQHLHALIFPEFGMDPTAIQLGCLRLAPIQFASWGHPVTSGLSTIDYFLSSDLMEPEEAGGDYSETLVRLPNSSMHYRLPTVDPEPLRREDLDVPSGAVIYWCCQSLFKYLPQHDDVFPRIAQNVDNAVFVFLSRHGSVVERCFKERMAAAFAGAGLDMDTHCRFLPELPRPTFAAVTGLIDVFLDNIGWSGGSTTLEAIAADRPVVTVPGEFMRGRHTKAFLEIMGLEDWVAADKDEYVALAVRLGRDEDLRRSVSGQVRARKHRLYRDPAPVRALEAFLERAVAGYDSTGGQDESPVEPAEDPGTRPPDDSDEGAILWARGLHHQRRGNLEQAAAALRQSLELKNPVYAAWQPRPQRAPDQPVTAGDERIELAGLSYPAIRPVSIPQSRPFWSVVIPVYNRDRFLLECLASVLAQYPGEEEMEIIVIDNGSDPPLEALVESIGKGIVRYHRHDKTLPLQRNWNSAVSAGRGLWVHLLHDDDYVLPGFYRALREGLADAPDTIGAAFTAYENINEDDEVVFRQALGDQRGPARDWISRIGVSNVLNPPAVVVRRDSYERLGGYSDEILYTTDWELYLRLASFTDWWFEPEILVRYRQHGDNVTAEQNRAGAQGEAFWRAIDMAERYLPAEVRDGVSARARRHYFNWCLERLRLPLQAGSSAGALRLLQEMFRLDRSEGSLSDAFDWLATTFAAPLWPPLVELYESLPAPDRDHPTDDPAALFDWLRSARAEGTRHALADALVARPPVECEDRFRFTESSAPP